MTKLNRRSFGAVLLAGLPASRLHAQNYAYDEEGCTLERELDDWKLYMRYKREVLPTDSGTDYAETIRYGFTHPSGVYFTVDAELGGDKERKSYFGDIEDLLRTTSAFSNMRNRQIYDYDPVKGASYADPFWIEIVDLDGNWSWRVDGRLYKDSLGLDGVTRHYLEEKRMTGSYGKLISTLMQRNIQNLEIVLGFGQGSQRDVVGTVRLSNYGMYKLGRNINDYANDLLENASRTSCDVQPVSDCFLTTACCYAYGRPDNGFELQTLRYFRDNWMARHPRMQRDVFSYYEIAPKLCEAIEQDPKKEQILRQVYFGTVLPCVALIKMGLYRPAYWVYRSLVRRLEKRYEIASVGR